ncbi:unnamed protein product [Soboliphyme baturini]|uniref:Tnp_DNA_bind domain-containing protein n=1 Tax=Soboliphyme baturini TaxID=241478 RepID=A0A183IRP0_9BILA|nr:unnamed protein product [Soboliphyme baturini]
MLQKKMNAYVAQLGAVEKILFKRVFGFPEASSAIHWTYYRKWNLRYV